MKKITRNICSIIVVMILLITLCIPSYANTLEINKEKLKEGFSSIFIDDPDDNLILTENIVLKEVNDKAIVIKIGSQELTMNYKITENSIIFNQAAKITNGMTYEAYEAEIEKLSMPLLGYIAVNNIAGVELEKSVTYMMVSILKTALGNIEFGTDIANNGYMIVEDGVEVESTKNLKVIKKSEFGKYAIEYTEAMYKNIKKYNDSSDLNTFSIEYVQEKKDEEYIVESFVTVNLKADFSKVNAISFDGKEECPSGKHKYSEEVMKQASCGVEGIKKFTCSDCKNTYYENIKAKEHEYVETISKQPTCTQMGTKRFTCKNCNKTYTETIPVVGHDYVERIRTENGCEKDGIVGYICNNCGDMSTKVIKKAKGHDYDITVKSATCKTSGSETYTCNDCGNTYTKYTEPVKEHEYRIDTMEDGSKKYTCINCNNSYVERTTNADTHEPNENKTILSKVLDSVPVILIVVGALIVILVVTLIILNLKKNY